MTRLNARATIAAAAAAVLGFILTMAAPASASADGQIVVTRPDGSSPGKLFTDLTFVPGDTKTEKLVVSQTTDQDVMTGVRFESTSPHGPLHDSAEVTISGFGDSVSVPLGEAVDTESPFWLGSLSPGSKESVTITVHLPQSSGNDTKREQARFRVIVSAQSDLPDDDASADADAGDPDSNSDANAAVAGDEAASVEGDESTGSDGDDSAGGNGSTGGNDESAATEGHVTTAADGNETAGTSGGSSTGTDENGSDSSADGSIGADGSLPRTGPESLSALVVAAGLLLIGAITVIAVRTRGRQHDRSGPTPS